MIFGSCFFHVMWTLASFSIFLVFRFPFSLLPALVSELQPPPPLTSPSQSLFSPLFTKNVGAAVLIPKPQKQANFEKPIHPGTKRISHVVHIHLMQLFLCLSPAGLEISIWRLGNGLLTVGCGLCFLQPWLMGCGGVCVSMR